MPTLIAPRLTTAKELGEWFAYDPSKGRLTWKKSPAMRVKVGAPAGTRKVEENTLRVTLKGVSYQAARIAWTLANGPVPAGTNVHIRNGDADDLRLRNLYVKARSDEAAYSRA